ncbi:hypothetical protein IFM89_022216 [Coptis chinensis]|uniref:Uncharacterized protein n=1 Tax=Coptis chinensis TaxID=261450 RepID=A0A835IA63_9MAGN|nr:hypothetical protein IFM89_022216 [Coptis chinensis]
MTPQMNEDISSIVNEKIMDDEAGVSNVQEQGIVESDTEVSEAMASEWPLDGWNTIFPTVLDTWMGEIPKASLRDKEGLYVEFTTYEYLAIKVDQSGTVVEVLLKDGKPVSIDTVLSLSLSLRVIASSETGLCIAGGANGRFYEQHWDSKAHAAAKQQQRGYL